MNDLREVRPDAEGHRLLLERQECAETIAAIRRGMNDADEGRIPLADAVTKLRAKHGL